MAQTVPDQACYSHQVIEMLTVANEYCLFLEKAEDYNRDQILEFVQKIGPLLYLKGALLPAVEISDPLANERFVTEEQWQELFLVLQNNFGKDDIFWSSRREGPDEHGLAKASLAEHLADIYQDMKDFVILYQKNRLASKENAAAECRQLFRMHWGPRLADIQRPIHFILFGEEEENQFNDFLSSL